MNKEQERLKDNTWKKWGPYVSARQWGTVREDYSPNGDAWNYVSHDMARSKAFRWGEEGIAGISDDEQLLCFAPAFWNHQDPIIKERFFGLTNAEGNHGEDVKELYYYLNNTPTHSYMHMLYKYPQQTFPYAPLVNTNRQRTRQQAEFEIVDTGIFDQNKYFDIAIEYTKESPTTILIQITVMNRSQEEAAIQVIPTIWFRNTWAWGYDSYKPFIQSGSGQVMEIFHQQLGQYYLTAEGNPQQVYCENETNVSRLYHQPGSGNYYKDGINNYLVDNQDTVNPENKGTKAAFIFEVSVPAQDQVSIRLCLSQNPNYDFATFSDLVSLRKQEADEFYQQILKINKTEEAYQIKKQALAGLLWNKQFYYFDVHQWLKGDPGQPPPPPERLHLRNDCWKHVNAKEILSMPDKWEYPWFAAWDMAFHCFPLALVDLDFAKSQLLYLTKEWYMHPNGQLPAYEWNFSDSNPPIHAMITWEIYRQEKAANNGQGDVAFLTKVFHKLMLNFTWWVNNKDEHGNNIFEGGFLGLDNIGVFDRNTILPGGGHIEQADGTSWMAMYALNLMQIAHELSLYYSAYSDISAKFFEHFLYIAGAMNGLNELQENLWDEEDNFYYDRLRFPENKSVPLKVRSLVGLIPLFVVETVGEGGMQEDEALDQRMKWFRQNRPDLADLVSHWERKNAKGFHLISLMRGYRMKMTLKYLLDEEEFLSEYGIRSVSKFHQQHPFDFRLDGKHYSIRYTPGESDNNMFGGNSNWRGPIWIPLNFLIIQGLKRFYQFYGDEFKVECPTRSGNYYTLQEVAEELSSRVFKIFKKNAAGKRPLFGSAPLFQESKDFQDYILFYEYFNGDTGQGLGAAHQTGWTALIATDLFQ
ncbi:MGH1-like glycoside hydrolase domain-containing protein [Adhaeribacter pallidiroseus]|uniref:Mannosylglycerate hydrolase MGH1-like glycoside hydrolase domain-containing protein n=1 Tax=Adhaeribacter pallidiroseus TaxID=2072847 RepID=A0A369QKU4_9BACT|nr:glucosidase [Adhaeribacter pallidiroseus]RDC63469.1 uncharacterized protein AHMF7616_02073 [Adhaeribacter pallidiroseus]